eukprot:TRINITY_DN24596_c0_g1_i1.p1 TRINITY_DN24596_c0_g1~~TRINITY_DN24596_c0_g1_i1.p1  ORF type:complete len:267 (+),score=29.16 TRINITY_DN24596_c0_g1_i1:673-1473(+)
MLNRLRRRTKKNHVARLTEKIVFWCGIAVFLLAVGTMVLFASVTSEAEWLLRSEGATISLGIRFLMYVVTFSPLVPSTLYLTMDLIALLKRAELEKAIRLKTLESCRINNSEALADLGNIGHVFLDKTGTLTQRNFRLDSLFAFGSLYKFDPRPRLTEMDKPDAKFKKPAITAVANATIGSQNNKLQKKRANYQEFTNQTVYSQPDEEKLDYRKGRSPRHDQPRSGVSGAGQAPSRGKHGSSTCLLYTSDAADDLLCVDLGGRRII